MKGHLKTKGKLEILDMLSLVIIKKHYCFKIKESRRELYNEKGCFDFHTEKVTADDVIAIFSHFPRENGLFNFSKLC